MDESRPCVHKNFTRYVSAKGFIGAHTISQAMLFNAHPNGKMQADEWLDALMAGVEFRCAVMLRTAWRCV